MNRYPLWKYIVIAVALAFGLFYTLPNFYPEVPAVQVSSSKSEFKIDTALLGTIESALKAANIIYIGAELDPIGIKVRFADPDTQLKAKDVLQSKLGNNYIVALNLLSSSPHWLASIGALPMYLGLDLRGGVHFLLQVDMKGALDKAADRYTTDIRSLMREKKVLYSGVGREGSNVVLRFRDAAERTKARVEIETAFPDLLVREQEGAGGELRLVAGLKPEAQTRIQETAVQQNITILRNRVNELGVAEPIIQQQGSDRVVVQLPGVQDTARAKDILGRTATQGWRGGAVAALGIGAGCFVHIFAAAAGLSALLAASATAFSVLKWIGAAYLVYVGVSMLRMRAQTVQEAPALQAAALRTVFLQGFLTNVLNPKVALFFLAFLPQFIEPGAASKALAFVFLGLIFNFNGTLWNLFVAWSAANIAGRLRRSGSAVVWLNRAVGAMFVYFGLRLAAAQK